MSAAFPTTTQLRTASKIARRFTVAACEERRADLDRILDQGVRFLEACHWAGMTKSYTSDVAKGLHDELTNLMAGIDSDLDDVGEPPADPLCMVELEELL